MSPTGWTYEPADYMTVKEVAQFMNWSERRVRYAIAKRWLIRGKLWKKVTYVTTASVSRLLEVLAEQAELKTRKKRVSIHTLLHVRGPK